MVALRIRDVPEEVRDALVARARAQRQSLQALLLSLVAEEASRSGNLALLNRFTSRADGSTLTAAEAADVLAQARAQRDEQLVGDRGAVGVFCCPWPAAGKKDRCGARPRRYRGTGRGEH